ncbi:hypothetical protein AGMMS49593_04720 [Endomicrobiia bacterium]|nr:hypothetical protein AGMMS49593_04720 [Endomicrobiia bacterium]
MIRKFRLFFRNNRIWFIVGSIVVGLVGLSIYGLNKLESYPRSITLAHIPLDLLLGLMHSIFYVFMYMIVFRRGGFFGNFKKNKVKAKDVAISFKEVVGLEGAKKRSFGSSGAYKGQKTASKNRR